MTLETACTYGAAYLIVCLGYVIYLELRDRKRA